MTKRALISVYNKDGVVEFAHLLVERNWEIVSTGGTARLLKESGLPVTGVEEITGFPEILEGRVKTLHPYVHGGILARREKESHLQELNSHGINPLDMVVVNLYPFKEVVSRPDVTREEALENIDIGGPTMIRAAAKNYHGVIVVVNPERYGSIMEELDEDGELSEDLRYQLAVEAFAHTAEYDSFIASYLNQQSGEEDAFPAQVVLPYRRVQHLRYGENPQQKAAYYRDIDAKEGDLSNYRQWQGKELSFNNINDLNAAWELVKEFKETAVVAVKHTNPCGVGVADSVKEAYSKAYDSDPVSIFGGIVAVNREVDPSTAEEMNRIFLEVIAAPSFHPEALKILENKPDIRLLTIPIDDSSEMKWDFKKTSGGLLIQEVDNEPVRAETGDVVTQAKPDSKQLEDLTFALKVVKHVKSNAIVVVSSGQTLGVGAGQMNRVNSARIALNQAGEKAKGAVMASDAFFPFPDTAEVAAKAGIKAIVQPGGSMKDKESIEVCNQHGITMVFTGRRYFQH